MGNPLQRKALKTWNKNSVTQKNCSPRPWQKLPSQATRLQSPTSPIVELVVLPRCWPQSTCQKNLKISCSQTWKLTVNKVTVPCVFMPLFTFHLGLCISCTGPNTNYFFHTGHHTTVKARNTAQPSWRWFHPKGSHARARTSRDSRRTNFCCPRDLVEHLARLTQQQLYHRIQGKHPKAQDKLLQHNSTFQKSSHHPKKANESGHKKQNPDFLKKKNSKTQHRGT